VVPALAIGPRIKSNFAKHKRSQLVLVQMQQFLHGDNAKEFVLMTEAGMPAMKLFKFFYNG
jgi:hypothetical protein